MFMTVCVVSANIGLMLWIAFVLFRAFARENKDTRVMQRIMSLGRDQASIRRRTFDAQGSRTVANPFSGVLSAEANGEIEMVDRLERLEVLRK